MLSLQISSDTEYLSIDSLAPEMEESIRELMRLGGVLHWNRDGEIRMVPLAILLDVFEAYDFWAAAPDRYQFDRPDAVGRIRWVDTQAIRTPLTEPS